jgi:predicted nucleotidyltransferase
MNDQKNITHETQKLKKDLHPLFEGDPLIQSVYLLGSKATGHAGLESDIDIADVCPNYHLNPLLTCVSN